MRFFATAGATCRSGAVGAAGATAVCDAGAAMGTAAVCDAGAAAVCSESLWLNAAKLARTA